MKRRPNETERIVDLAIKNYGELGTFVIVEPKKDGERISLKREMEGNHFVKYERDGLPPAKWTVCTNPDKVIEKYSDWL